MFLHIFTVIAIVGSLTGKPSIARNISDCSITDDGILLYHGKQSITKFDHECLHWTDLQTMYSEIINEPKFVHDRSIKAAENYCRNPNMNVNGPWCFVANEDVVTMEQCDVCQSLASKPTLPTDIDSIDEATDGSNNNGFFQTLRDEIKRYAIYIRDKFLEIVQRVRKQIRNIGSKISAHFD